MDEIKKESKCCNTCSREIMDHWNFCPWCGTQLKEEIRILSPEQCRAIQSESFLCGKEEGWSK